MILSENYLYTPSISLVYILTLFLSVLFLLAIPVDEIGKAQVGDLKTSLTSRYASNAEISNNSNRFLESSGNVLVNLTGKVELNQSSLNKVFQISQEFRTYSNATNHYDIEYPRNWSVQTNQSTVWFGPHLSSGYVPLISITTIPIRNITHTTSLEELVSQNINSIRSEIFKDDSKYLTLNHSKYLKIDNKSAYMIRYESNGLRNLEYYIQSGGNVYLLTSQQPSLLHDFISPVIESMVKSLDIKNPVYQAREIPGIAVYNSPKGMDINYEFNKLYVANQGSNVVSVIDLGTGIITKNITVQSKPFDVAVNPSDKSVYVTNSGKNSISIIDGVTHTVVGQVDTKRNPTSLAIDPNLNDRLIFVSDTDDNAVSVISSNTNKRISDIFVGKHPTSLAINPSLNRLYVANTGSNSISVIDYVFERSFKSVENEISVGDYPTDLALDLTRNKLYVANQISNDLTVLDATSLKKLQNISTSNPSQITIDEKRNLLFILSVPLNILTIVDGDNYEVLNTVTLEDSPTNIVSNTNDDFVYISNDRKGKIYIMTKDGNLTTMVNFKINPSGMGQLQCGEKELRNIKNNEYQPIIYNTTLECRVQNIPDHSFDSWSFSQDESNSFLQESLVHNFTIVDFSTISANFKDTSIQQILNSEVRNILGAVIAAPIIGFLIQYLIERRERKIQSKQLKAYMSLIDKIMDENTTLSVVLELLEQKRKDIKELLKEGVLRESTYEILLNHIDKAEVSTNRKFSEN